MALEHHWLGLTGWHAFAALTWVARRPGLDGPRKQGTRLAGSGHARSPDGWLIPSKSFAFNRRSIRRIKSAKISAPSGRIRSKQTFLGRAPVSESSIVPRLQLAHFPRRLFGPRWVTRSVRYGC